MGALALLAKAMPRRVIGYKNLKDFVEGFLNGQRPDAPPPDAQGRVIGQSLPPTPSMEPGSEPRSNVISYGYNASYRPRQGLGIALTPYQQLRALADFDLVRLAIEDQKAQIRGMHWEVVPTAKYKGQEKRLGRLTDEVRAFVEMPDPLAGLDWNDWVGSVLEEVAVTDALTLLPRFDLGGQFIGLEQIDGATITPLVDARGRPPLPPAEAFLQIVNGIPETGFRLGEIMYMPSNRRPDVPYGRSKVENVLFHVNLAIRTNLHDLAFFTDGNVPDGGLYAVKGVGPEQMEKFQRAFDDILAGRSELRSGSIRMVPEGMYFGTKERQWQYEFMEWLARVVAWGFGISPLPIAKQQNRSTGETMARAALEKGVRPTADFLLSVVNRALRLYGNVKEVEVKWADDETEDPSVVYLRSIAQLQAGALTLNELRAGNALQPYEIDTPPMIWVNGVPTRLEDVLAAKPQPAPTDGGDPNAPPPKPGEPTDATPPPADAKKPAPEQTPQEKAWAAAFAKYRTELARDLSLWKHVLAKRAKAGKPPKVFRSTVIPPALRKQIEATGFDAAAAQTIAAALLTEIRKAELKPGRSRRKLEIQIRDAVVAWMDDVKGEMVAWAVAQLPADKIAKAEGEPPKPDGTPLANDLEGLLAEGFGAGAVDAASAMGVTLGQTPAEAATYARDRAGELVGKKLVGGEWVENPDKRFAITETLRDRVQELTSTAVKDGWSPAKLASAIESDFGEARAEVIARTETGYAYGNGAAEIYSSQEIQNLQVLDGDGCLPEGHQDGAAAPSGDPGVVEDDAQANGQIWTVAQYQADILGHPQCVRAAIPYIADSSEE